MIQISPSLVSAPLLDLAAVIKRLEAIQIDYLHFDIEDGSFVREMNLGTKIIKDVRGFTTLPIDVHLMMVEPEWIIPLMAEMGVNMLSFHYEATQYPRRVLRMIAERGMQAGLAFNPKSPIPDLTQYQPYLHFVNILTTEPEIGGAVFLPEVLQKVRLLKKDLPDMVCEVDGGVTLDNYREVVEAGADILVSGRGLFANDQFEDTVEQLRNLP